MVRCSDLGIRILPFSNKRHKLPDPVHLRRGAPKLDEAEVRVGEVLLAADVLSVAHQSVALVADLMGRHFFTRSNSAAVRSVRFNRSRTMSSSR